MSGAASPQCIDVDTAASFAAHGLLAEQRLEVEQHIDTCPSCRELISTVAKVEWSRPSSDDHAEGDGAVLRPGTRVGPFEIDQPLDAGGMGLVYSAHDARLDRRVALKCIRERRGDPEQLLREAQLMAQLAHPNVVPVYDVLEAFGQVFLAMELVVGRNLRQWIEESPRTWKAVVDVFLDAGAGLAAAHAAGIVHGDVKPANILVGDDGRVRVTDFGLASFVSQNPDAQHGIRGTPAYLAPEHRAGKPSDARGDQYSFCVSLHEALYGAVPGRPPARPVRVPRGVQRVLARGLLNDPAARYPSMKALLGALRAVRASRSRWALAAVLLTSASVATAYTVGGRRVEAEQCAAASAQLATPWNAQVRGLVRTSFGRTGLSYANETLARVDANLDAWANTFEAARRRACEATWFNREVPLERFGAELSCLKDSAREVRALASELQGADATVVLNSIAATEELTPVERCSQTRSAVKRAALPDGPEVSHLKDELARGQALVDSGKFREALPVSTGVMQAADALGDPALIAPARVLLGSNQSRLDDYEHADANLLEAIRLAEIGQDDRASAAAWVGLVRTEYRRGHHEQVVFMKGPALGACERAGDVLRQTDVMLMLGGSLSQLGRASEAQPILEEAVRLRIKIYGEHDRRVSFALSSLGSALSMQGNLQGGIDAHRRALDAAEISLGRLHPKVGILHGNLGDDFLYGLRAEEAVAELEKAVAILEAANGPKNRDVVVAMTDLGLAYFEAGQFEKALEHFDRANEFWTVVMPKHGSRAEALLGRYETLRALGRPAPLKDLELAESLSNGLPPFERGRIQLALGRALVADDKTTPRAAELVRAGLSGLKGSSLPLMQREAGQARGWLSKRGIEP